MKSISDIIMLAGTGVNLIIDAEEISTADLISIAGSIRLHESHVIIRNADCKSTSDLIMISTLNSKNITFDLTDISTEKK